MSQPRKTNSATQRLKQDYLRLKKDPVPYVVAEPLPANILEWHYAVTGPEGTPYEGGIYHGKLVFPREFPFKPPSIYMTTPNGRFKTNTRLCLSISDFHPDSWNPAWSVSTILTGLLSFMIEKSPTLGSIESSDHEKRVLAAQSLEFNLKDKIFRELFPDLVEKIKSELEQRRKVEEESRRPAAADAAVAGAGGGASSGLPGAGVAAGRGGGLGQQQPQGALHHAIANICVIIGFAAFAYTVKYVLRTIAAE
ncbi:ubiquitin-conjugating enzyme E2 J2 [Schistocerca gregaria]|uniref:ubiquitin-conjugating enzyme E2 J2 n=1 Tax=Schistocerca gregaria TaxID=7010 RepID=UPI00211EE37C|nr:ubiquitin-conjugating enzyme E2 J2 [Schistocerca gregaria]XP_049843952.1 ubiquitin-conjugating enzyme E2 J2 [Schistocerca gregaria]XP_049843953.1 ubiquitin-conjugating enzyme E2 J2 [Schistocerca gregaria]XP_049843954.1 ubiquitin-conjugating enzyme E2 J2 [Schistocerca gregaria]XP_049843955.1 ubiquitin-conjugating enzyme E2 J2 [Schistocerca gregaria]